MTYWHTSNNFQRWLYRVQCRQTLAVAVRVPTRAGISVWQTIASVDTLSYQEETKQHRRPIAGLPLLEFSPAPESWFDIYTGPTSCLPQTFPSFVFICHLYLSVARLFTERSLLRITSRHAPYCWLATSLFWYPAPTPFSKGFWKMTYPTFNWSMLPHLSHLFKRARAGLNEPHWTRYRAGTLVKLSGLRGSIVLKHGSDPLVWVHPKLNE